MSGPSPFLKAAINKVLEKEAGRLVSEAKAKSGSRLPTPPEPVFRHWPFGTVLRPVDMPWSTARCMAVNGIEAVVLRDDDEPTEAVGEIISITPGYWEPAE